MVFLNCLGHADSVEQIHYLPKHIRDRKLRLFACACCRRLGDWLNPTTLKALDVAEQYADGLASETERRETFEALVMSRGGAVWSESTHGIIVSLPIDFILRVTALAIAIPSDQLLDREMGRWIAEESESTKSVCRVVDCSRLALDLAGHYRQSKRQAELGFVRRIWDRVLREVAHRIDPTPEATLNQKIHHQELVHQAELLHDILGDLFRPVPFPRSWRTDTAVTLARQMYDSRDFGAMPILADALQDAGCNSNDVLNHCRATQQVHVRGCWIVDLVLAQE